MKHIVLIPVYNDWKSLEKLISKLDFYLSRVKKISNEILIINDNSSKEPVINCKNLKTINYSQLVAVLIQAIQELSQELENIKKIL